MWVLFVFLFCILLSEYFCLASLCTQGKKGQPKTQWRKMIKSCTKWISSRDLTSAFIIRLTRPTSFHHCCHLWHRNVKFNFPLPCGWGLLEHIGGLQRWSTGESRDNQHCPQQQPRKSTHNKPASWAASGVGYFVLVGRRYFPVCQHAAGRHWAVCVCVCVCIYSLKTEFVVHH